MARLMFGQKHYVALRSNLIKATPELCKSFLAVNVLNTFLPHEHKEKFAVVMAVPQGQQAP